MEKNKEAKLVSDLTDYVDARAAAYSMIDVLYKQNMINKATYENVQKQQKKECRHPQQFTNNVQQWDERKEDEYE